MSDASVQGAFTNLRLIRWLLGQGENVQAIIGYYDAFVEAPTVRAKWYDAVRPTGDLLVDLIDTLPAVEANEVVMLADVQSQAVALGIDWNKLVGVAEKLLPLVIDLLLRTRG